MTSIKNKVTLKRISIQLEDYKKTKVWKYKTGSHSKKTKNQLVNSKKYSLKDDPYYHINSIPVKLVFIDSFFNFIWLVNY